MVSKEEIRMEDDGRVYLPKRIAKLLYMKSGRKSKKRRIQKKWIAKMFSKALREYLDTAEREYDERDGTN